MSRFLGLVLIAACLTFLLALQFWTGNKQIVAFRTVLHPLDHDDCLTGTHGEDNATALSAENTRQLEIMRTRMEQLKTQHRQELAKIKREHKEEMANISGKLEENDRRSTSSFAPSGSQLASSSSLCTHLLSTTHPQKSTAGTSTSLLWQKLGKKMLNASYFPPKEGLAGKPLFQDWIDQLYAYYTPQRLRRSISTPADPNAIKRIIQILDEYPQTREPLRIVVTGGSVTAGNSCGSTPTGIPGGPTRLSSWEPCGWPIRFQHILNEVLFNGEERIEVINTSSGGVSSKMTSVMLKYQLFNKKDVKKPHVLMLAHSANDQGENKQYNEIYQSMQELVEHAKNIRQCDDNLPLIVLVDDFYGVKNPIKQMEQTARVHAMAAWFHLMSISYGNIVRAEVLGRYDADTTLSEIEPLMGNNFDLHFGMGMHIGMSWAIVFNFLNEILESCQEDVDVSAAGEQLGKITVLKSNVTVSAGSGRFPLKHIGHLQHDSTMDSIVNEWKYRVEKEAIRCQGLQHFNNESSSSSSSSHNPLGPPCDYAWIFNRNSATVFSWDIDKALKDVLTHSDGWVTKGRPVLGAHDRTGWYATQRNSTFSLKIPVQRVVPESFTIVFMKTWHPDYADSKLDLNIEVVRDNSNNNETGTVVVQQNHQLTPYQKVKTSVPVEATFPLSGKVQLGDTIYLNGTLSSGIKNFSTVNGTLFKIEGLLFCKSFHDRRTRNK